MGKRILLVDDEARLVHLVRGYLEQDGYEVATAGDGRAALLVSREFDPDLIILDLMMPEMDGWEFMRYLRRERDTPVIMLTARVDENDRIAGLEMGADDYLTKPFSPRELTARVRAVLRRAKPGESTPAERLRVAGLEVDPDAHIARRDGRALDTDPDGV